MSFVQEKTMRPFRVGRIISFLCLSYQLDNKRLVRFRLDAASDVCSGKNDASVSDWTHHLFFIKLCIRFDAS
jgi:hypothetical protein